MSWDAFQERIFLEGQLERRLQFFLFFFIGTIVVSLIISRKEMAMIFLVAAVIVSWLLTVSLWFFVNRINSADKALAATTDDSPKFMDRTLRFFLAKVLPITASVILTVFLMAGVSGVADSILPYKQKAAEVIEKGKVIIESVEQKQPDRNHFVSVDSVVDNTKTTPRKGAEVTFDNTIISKSSKEIKKDEQINISGESVKPAPKKVNVILAVDGSHQAPKQGTEETRANESSSPANTQSAATKKPDPNFAPVEKVIEKTTQETKAVSKKVIPAAKKDSAKKKIQPNPNFKEIERVIKK